MFCSVQTFQMTLIVRVFFEYLRVIVDFSVRIHLGSTVLHNRWFLHLASLVQLFFWWHSHIQWTRFSLDPGSDLWVGFVFWSPKWASFSSLYIGILDLTESCRIWLEYCFLFSLPCHGPQLSPARQRFRRFQLRLFASGQTSIFPKIAFMRLIRLQLDFLFLELLLNLRRLQLDFRMHHFVSFEINALVHVAHFIRLRITHFSQDSPPIASPETGRPQSALLCPRDNDRVLWSNPPVYGSVPLSGSSRICGECGRNWANNPCARFPFHLRFRIASSLECVSGWPETKSKHRSSWNFRSAAFAGKVGCLRVTRTSAHFFGRLGKLLWETRGTWADA